MLSSSYVILTPNSCLFARYTNTKTQSQGGRTRRFKESDRLFSSSSLSAPVRKATGGDDDDVDERRKRKKDKRVREMKKIRTDTSYDQ